MRLDEACGYLPIPSCGGALHGRVPGGERRIGDWLRRPNRSPTEQSLLPLTIHEPPRSGVLGAWDESPRLTGYEEATTHLGHALVLADACAAPYKRTLTLLALAELRGASGATDGAVVLLDEAREIGARLGAAPSLARADRIAAAWATVPATRLVYPAGLSAREVEVLRLVAAGLSNVQVAERLFLSPRTINGHLTTIYTKLNVPSRSAAIRFAFDHGLH